MSKTSKYVIEISSFKEFQDDSTWNMIHQRTQNWLVVSNIFYFHPENWGRWTHFDWYFSIGLKPPTRNSFKFQITFLVKFYRSTFWFSIGHTTMESISPKDLSCVSGGLRPSRGWVQLVTCGWEKPWLEPITVNNTLHKFIMEPQKMMDSKRNLLLAGCHFQVNHVYPTGILILCHFQVPC